jgi:hypothetical protein
VSGIRVRQQSDFDFFGHLLLPTLE